MKYVILFRKLIIDGTPYYQGFMKAEGKELSEEKIKITDGKYKGKVASPFETMEDFLYMEINKTQYDAIEDSQIYVKIVDNVFQEVSDFSEVADVALKFYEKYHDFKLIPEYDIDKLISKTRDDLREKLLGQDEPINKILTKIYNNQMYFNSDLSKDYLTESKSNILVLGPVGTGKTTIKDSLKKNLEPIPVVEIKLTGNYNKDMFEMAKKLVYKANGNRFLAERGIVIVDELNDFTACTLEKETGKMIYYLDTLRELMKSRVVYFSREDGSSASFDCSLLTFVCMTDIDYDYQEEEETEEIKGYLYYTHVDSSKLYDLGFSGEMINECFDEEVIYMKEMTKELALKILKDKEKSPIYRLKKTLEKNNRLLEIKDGFLEELAEYGLLENEGFKGILKIFKYLVESKGYKEKTIVLDPSDLYDLQIGSFIVEEEEENTSEDSVSNSKIEKQEGLEVDLKKRTINGLTVKDTVDIINKSVKGQEKAIFSVVNSFYNHIFNRHRGYTKKELRELKENVLLFGSTGVGKTAIINCLAEIFEIPFVREIATRYSKAGYKGEDVDSMLYDLVEAAKGDIKKAENGILYIDEIDKIRAPGEKDNSDGMVQGVQYNLLTLIEGDVRTLEGNMNRRNLTFDTSNLWIVGTGAFDGIQECIKARLKKENGLGKVGFGEAKTISKFLPSPTDDDLYAYGLDRQFAGRFPHKVSLQDMNSDILYDIINNPDGGYITLVKKGYTGDGIVLSMSEGFKRALAKKALAKKQGARGIHSAFMHIKDTIDENIQNGDVEKVILDETCIDHLENIQYVKRKK